MGPAPALTPLEWAGVVFMGGLMWGSLAWFLKRWMLSVEKSVVDEAVLRNKGLDSIRGAVNELEKSFRTFELEVTREYVARVHLTEALQPLMDRVEGFRDDIKELYGLVHTKQDRRGAD